MVLLRLNTALLFLYLSSGERSREDLLGLWWYAHRIYKLAVKFPSWTFTEPIFFWLEVQNDFNPFPWGPVFLMQQPFLGKGEDAKPQKRRLCSISGEATRNKIPQWRYRTVIENFSLQEVVDFPREERIAQDGFNPSCVLLFSLTVLYLFHASPPPLTLLRLLRLLPPPRRRYYFIERITFKSRMLRTERPCC